MDTDSEVESVYDTASSTNSRLGLSTDVHYQRLRELSETQDASNPPDRSMSHRSMSRTPDSKYRDNELVKKSSPAEFGATIDEVLNNAESAPKNEGPGEGSSKVDDHRSISSEICVSPSWSRAAQKKRDKKEQRKKLEQEQKELEKKLKQEAKRKSRFDPREPRRLQKKTPPVSSSRASSAHSMFQRVSAGSSFVSMWSKRTSRASSVNEPNEEIQDEVKKKPRRFSFGDNSLGKKLAFWPRRSAKPQETMTTSNHLSAGSLPTDTQKRSLHTVRKHTDLRASAKASGDFQDRLITAADAALTQPGSHRNVSGPSNQTDGYAKSKAPQSDHPALATEQDGVFASPEQRIRMQAITNVKSVPATPRGQSLGSRAIASMLPGVRQHAKRQTSSQSTQTDLKRSNSRSVGGAEDDTGKMVSEKQTTPIRNATLPQSPTQNGSAVSKKRPKDQGGSKGINLQDNSPKETNGKSNGVERPEDNVFRTVSNEVKTSDAKTESTATNPSWPDHPRMSSSYIREVNSLAVKAPANGAQPSPVREYKIVNVQPPNKSRRNSFHEYMEAKRISIRQLAQGKKDINGASDESDGKEKSAESIAKGLDRPNLEPEIVVPAASSATPNGSTIVNGENPTSPVPEVKDSKQAEPVTSSRPRRNSFDLMQKFRVTGGQKLRKRVVSAGDTPETSPDSPVVEKAAEKDVKQAGKDINNKSGADKNMDESLSPNQTLQPAIDTSVRPLASGLAANTGKKIASHSSNKEPAAAPPSPSLARPRGNSEFIPTTPSALSLHRGIGVASISPMSPMSSRTAGSNRTVGQQIAKMFVICCQCKHWHDMTSQAYTKLAFPSASPQDSDGLTPLDGLESPPKFLAGSPLGSANSSRTNIAIKDGKAAASAARPNSGSKALLLNHSTVCCWCCHQMAKSCCAGWTTVVTMRERHH